MLEGFLGERGWGEVLMLWSSSCERHTSSRHKVNRKQEPTSSGCFSRRASLPLLLAALLK
jgi:hypothetical protein